MLVLIKDAKIYGIRNLSRAACKIRGSHEGEYYDEGFLYDTPFIIPTYSLFNHAVGNSC
jgi:hypothetical protein